MPRPPNALESIPVTFTATPKLVLYLDDLIAEQGFGNSRSEVARTLVWESVRTLISEGVLDRRPATANDRREVTKRAASMHRGTPRRSE